MGKFTFYTEYIQQNAKHAYDKWRQLVFLHNSVKNRKNTNTVIHHRDSATEFTFTLDVVP